MSDLARHDQVFFASSDRSLAGVDEVGRGPLAGPVTAAVCAIPHGLVIEGIADSKRLTPKRRQTLAELLSNHPEIDSALGWVAPDEIDATDIHRATLKAMALAVLKLTKVPDVILIDGRFSPHQQGEITLTVPKERCFPLIRGDQRSQAIAAASILAKVARDEYMDLCDRSWPNYGFSDHRGYPTSRHLEAIERWGPCPIHRLSFRPFCTQSPRARRGVQLHNPIHSMPQDANAG